MSLKTLAPNYQSRLASIMRNVGTGKRVLNLGCGDGYYNLHLAKRFKEVIASDVNETDLAIAKQNYHQSNVVYVVASATDLPFPDNHFDYIVCADVLEHIKDHKKAIREIARVLKKNGTAIITVPSADHPFSYDPINWILVRLFNRHLPIGIWGFGHLRLYTMKQLETLFQKVGLKPKKRLYLLHFFCGLFENYYLINLLQPLTKSDPKNLDQVDEPKNRPSEFAFAQPPQVLRSIRDAIMHIDHMLCGKSKKSLGIFLQVQKPALWKKNI